MNNNQEWRGLEFELAELDRKIAECVEIPNEWLPKEYHNKKDGCQTVSRLHQICDKKDGITDHVKKKADKAKNIELYRNQLENNGEIEYNGIRDDAQLHRNQSAIVQAWIDTRVITSEDLENEI